MCALTSPPRTLDQTARARAARISPIAMKQGVGCAATGLGAMSRCVTDALLDKIITTLKGRIESGASSETCVAVLSRCVPDEYRWCKAPDGTH